MSGRCQIGHTQDGWKLTLHARVKPEPARWDETREPLYDALQKRWLRLGARQSTRPTLYVTIVGTRAGRGVELRGRGEVRG